MSREEYANPPWMCARCGYAMDTASPAGKGSGRGPCEDDISLCLNCGAAYVMHTGKWTRMTAAEEQALPYVLRGKLNILETIRREALGGKDLSKRDPRA